MKTITIFFLSLFFLGCSSKQSKEAEISEPISELDITNKEFKSIIQSLPDVELPYLASCSDNLQPESVNFKNLYRPIGKIKTPYEYIVILDISVGDSSTPPVAKTFDSDGKLIDSEKFFYTYCGSDILFYSKQYISIQKDLVVNFTDSTWVYEEVEGGGDRIEGSEKLEIKKHFFVFKSDGQIEKRDKDER